MSGLTGDYASLAEAVGEAPPRDRFNTVDELAELYHGCGGDDEMAEAIMSYAHHEDARNRAAWYREREREPLADVNDAVLLEECRNRGLL